MFSWPLDGIGDPEVTKRSSSLSLCYFKERILSTNVYDPFIKSFAFGDTFYCLINETEPLKLLRGNIGDY